MKKIFSLILALVMLLSLASCGAGNEEKKEKEEKEKVVYKDKHGKLAKEAEEKLPEYILEAIRAYYGLPIGGELTDKMIASVEEIKIADIQEKIGEEGGYYIDAAINGSKYYGIGIAPGYIKEERFRLSYQSRIAELRNEELSDIDAKSIENFVYYLYYMNPTADGLTEQDIKKMIQKYPECQDGAIYVMETQISAHEVSRLLNAFDLMYDIPHTVETETIDLSCLEVFPNLKKVFCRKKLTAVNCPVEVESFDSFTN